MDISLEAGNGEQFAIVGPSGAGKTTLLRLIAGLETPDRGRIVVNGRDVTAAPPHHRDIGLVPQRSALYPHLSVLENLAVGLRLRPRRERPAEPEIRMRVDEAVQLLGLGPILGNRPHQLSGGEQQRVMLGRLLVRRPSIWLLDEPFAHLDVPLREQLRRDMHLLRERFLPTIIAVTHDPVEALTSGDRLAVLLRGRVRQVGQPAAVLARPASSEVAGFLGQPPMNLTTGVLVRPETAGPALQFAAADGAFRLPVPAELVTHGAEGQPVTVGIRPEALEPLSDSPSTDAIEIAGWEVRCVELIPPAPLVSLLLGGSQWTMWWHGTELPEVGTRITLLVDTRTLQWFGQGGKRIAE